MRQGALDEADHQTVRHVPSRPQLKRDPLASANNLRIMSQHSWFIAVLVLQSRVGTWDDDPLVDHQVRLVRAVDAEAAYRRALELGRDEEAEYQNDDGERVAWEFLGLSSLDRLDEDPVDGLEVHSWRTRGGGAQFVLPKHRLEVFDEPASGHKTAREILDE